VKPGDLVLVRFPEADLQAGKLRPALVVAMAPGRHADILLRPGHFAGAPGGRGFDEVVAPEDPDFAATRLKARSIIRLARLASVNPQVIEARLGVISPSRLANIRRRLVEWLGS
jgi:mRNA interferase MazF